MFLLISGHSVLAHDTMAINSSQGRGNDFFLTGRAVWQTLRSNMLTISWLRLLIVDGCYCSKLSRISITLPQDKNGRAKWMGGRTCPTLGKASALSVHHVPAPLKVCHCAGNSNTGRLTKTCSVNEIFIDIKSSQCLYDDYERHENPAILTRLVKVTVVKLMAHLWLSQDYVFDWPVSSTIWLSHENTFWLWFNEVVI